MATMAYAAHHRLTNRATADPKHVYEAIRQAVASGITRPADIFAKLGYDYSDYLLKEAVLRLLREGELVLNPDRTLVLR